MNDTAARLEELLNPIWSEELPLPWNQTALIFQKAFHQEGIQHAVITYALKSSETDDQLHTYPPPGLAPKHSSIFHCCLHELEDKSKSHQGSCQLGSALGFKDCRLGFSYNSNCFTTCYKYPVRKHNSSLPIKLLYTVNYFSRALPGYSTVTYFACP